MKKHLIYTIALIISCLFLCSCKNTEAESAGNYIQDMVNIEPIPEAESIYQTNIISLNKEHSAAEIVGDVVYGGAISNSSPVVTVQDKNTGKIINEITVPMSGEALGIQSLASDNEGNIYLVVCNYTDNGTIVWKIDTAGTLHEMNNMVLEDTMNAQSQSIKKIAAGTDGNLYLWCEMGIPAAEIENLPYEIDADVYVMVDRIYVKNAELNTLFYTQVPAIGGSKLKYFYVSKRGKPVAVTSDDEGIYIREIDLEKRAFGDETKQIADSDEGEIETVAVTEDGLLFSRNGTLYMYNLDSNKTDNILCWATYGIEQSDILYIGENNNSIEVIDTHEGVSGYVNLSKGEVNKTVITLGLIQLTQDIQKAVIDFNRSNPDVMINIKTYYQEDGDFEQSVERLKLDVVTGSAPDIMEVSMINYEMLADKGVFADLYKFMQDDRDLSQDKILPSVREAYEIDGQLLNMAPGFQLYTVWGNRNKIGNHKGVTLNELMQILGENGKTIDAIYGFSMDEPVLTTLCTFGMDEFINWETGECEFTGDYFKDLLRFAKEYSGGYTQTGVSQAIAEGNILLSIGVISSVADYQIQSELYGGELTFVGYPTAGGSGTAIGYRGSQLAISNYSDDKGDAWEFVKYYMQNGWDGQGFPVFQDKFDEAMEKARQKDMETVDGVTYELPKGYFSEGSHYFEVFNAEPADVEAIRNLVADAGNRYKYNTDILGIINEEADAYFKDQKPIDEVAGIIQSRVKLYLDEQVR